MKKAMYWVITTIAIASIALSMVGCGQIDRIGSNTNTLINVTYGEGEFEYRKDTPDEVYEGYTKAKKTIENLLGTNVEIGPEYPAGSYLIKGMLKPVKTHQMKDYMLFRVPDYDSKPTVIIFLYNDDNNGCITSDVQKGYYDEENDKLDLSFESQLVNGAYAYRYDASSDCIVSEAAGTVSTVWEYNESTGTISLVWENWARLE